MALTEADADDTMAVRQVPMLLPKITNRGALGNTPLPIVMPDAIIEIKMVVTAAELCKAIVIDAPSTNRMKGLLILVKSSTKR